MPNVIKLLIHTRQYLKVVSKTKFKIQRDPVKCNVRNDGIKQSDVATAGARRPTWIGSPISIRDPIMDQDIIYLSWIKKVDSVNQEPDVSGTILGTKKTRLTFEDIQAYPP